MSPATHDSHDSWVGGGSSADLEHRPQDLLHLPPSVPCTCLSSRQRPPLSLATLNHSSLPFPISQRRPPVPCHHSSVAFSFSSGGQFSFRLQRCVPRLGVLFSAALPVNTLVLHLTQKLDIKTACWAFCYCLR